jgi:NitT/TauT family transport system substrate-binding protein
MKDLFCIALAVMVFAGTGSGCSGEDSGQRTHLDTESADTSRKATGTQVLRIAEQHGLAYLPLAIMQIENLLEQETTGIGDVRVDWIRTGNATMIREAMLSGRLDIGFMGIPPFLIGLDRGTEWRLLTGLSEAPVGLVTLKPGYHSIDDLEPRDRIAVPQPGSIQHILLAMASDDLWGEPGRFDDRLVSMGHPEGLTALLSRRNVTAQFTSPPYLFTALAEPDAVLLLEGHRAFGGRFTFIVGVAAPGWRDDPEKAAVREAFFSALDRAIVLARSLQAGTPESSRLLTKLSRFYGIDQDIVQEQLRHPGIVYTREVHGIDRFIDRMSRYGYITEGVSVE